MKSGRGPGGGTRLEGRFPGKSVFKNKHPIAFNVCIVYNDSMEQQEISVMATLTVRNIDAALKERLRIRAAQHGHSMEAELRDILKESLKEPEPAPEPNLYERIRARFAPLGGADDIELPPREPALEPPRFD